MKEKFREAVRASGMKYRYLAEKIGVKPPTFTAMMRGDRKISMDEFLTICRIINVDPNDFVQDDDENRIKAGL